MLWSNKLYKISCKKAAYFFCLYKIFHYKEDVLMFILRGRGEKNGKHMHDNLHFLQQEWKRDESIL